MEYLSGGSLQAYLKERQKNQQPLSDYEASQLMKGILSGVQYLHQKGIVHRDLKPQNMLIANEADLTTVKLIDFGLGTQNKGFNELNNLYCGTLPFMAPEVVTGQMYSKSVDVWAIGIIMHLALTGGKHPFMTDSDSPETFKEKLKNLTEVHSNKMLSKLAQNLF